VRHNSLYLFCDSLHTSWHCCTCDAVVYGLPLNAHCTALEARGSADVHFDLTDVTTFKSRVQPGEQTFT
jgi:hypothetical protein